MHKLLTVLIIVFCLVSCAKETTTQEPGNFIDDSTLLSRYIEIDTTKPATLDSLLRYEFKYDSNRRVKEIKLYTFNNITPNIPAALFTTTTIHYSGNDTLPRMRILVTGPAVTPIGYRDTTFLYYDANGRVKLDSLRHYWNNNPTYSYTNTMSFSYNNNVTTINQTQYYTIPVSFQSWTGAPSFDTRGNVFSLYQTNIVSNINYIFENSFTHDDHPNPFNMSGVRHYSIVLTGEKMFELSNTYHTNNITSFNRQGRRNGIPESPIKFSFNYNYKENGYPRKVYVYNISSGQPVYKKMGVYFYSKN